MPDFPSTKVRPLEERIDELTRRVIEMDRRLKKMEAIKSQAGIPDVHHAKYTDAEAQATVKTNVEVGDLKAPTKDLAMSTQRITGLAAATLEGDAIAADANVRAPDSSKLEGSTKSEVQTHAPAAHDHSGDTLSPSVINVGDIGFRNGWKLTEDDEHGLVFVSPEGKKYGIKMMPV